ncbi:hypothetical protein TNCT_476891 [Trichonephila clavata]|uniref:Uncharacterized protein n=1 Tax=Trichonephila clavata TaxID=2740835 RepID=A0A8X6IBB2_TRICU|nr:hypothetical protein TNCT_476891 [Trichonephila clavata]
MQINGKLTKSNLNRAECSYKRSTINFAFCRTFHSTTVRRQGWNDIRMLKRPLCILCMVANGCGGSISTESPDLFFPYFGYEKPIQSAKEFVINCHNC